MADTELKKLNNNVTDAVNILKNMYGNSAQVKAMNEKEREAINKLLLVADEEGENQKRQRAFTERERDENGRFVKKQEANAKTFMGMAKSIGGMFKGITKGIKTSLSSITKGIASNITGLFQSIKGHFVGLFGEESEWFDIMSSIKDSVKGFFGWFVQAFVFLFRRTPAWAIKTNKYLRDMYKLQIKQMKMDFMDTTGGAKKKGGVWGMLSMILLAIAAGIGAWLHRYLIVLTKLPIFAKISKMFSVIDDIPFIGKLFKAVKFGFKWLGWPLTILLSVIDFIRGYSETEGSTWEKIKGGLWKAIEGFIVLPVTFMGWVIETIAGWFGVELDNVGKDIMDFIKAMFNLVIFGWEQLGTLIWQEILVNIPKWTMKLIGILGDIVTWFYDFFVDFWNETIEWIKSVVPDWMMPDSVSQKLDSMTINKDQQSVTDTANGLTRYKINDQHKRDAKIDNLNDSIVASGKATEKAFNYSAYAPTTYPGGGSTVDTKQINDELDNIAVGFGNNAWGME